MDEAQGVRGRSGVPWRRALAPWPPLLAFAFVVLCASLPPSPGATQVPEGVETTVLEDGTTITVDGDDHVTVSGEGESWFGFNGYDYRKSVAFMAAFQRAIAAGDRAEAVAAVAFPLRINVTPHRVVRDGGELLRDFEGVVTAELASRIAAADPRKVSCNYKGIWLGDGVVWARKGEDGRYRVFAINP